MASQNDVGFKSFLATAALSAFVAVDIQADGSINAAASGAKGVGVLQEGIPAGAYANVKLWSAPGTFMLAVTNTAVTPGTLYSIATGGYASTVTGTPNPAYLKAVASAVASNGIVVEFAADLN